MLQLCGSDWMGKVSVPLVKMGFPEVLYQGQLGGRSSGQGAHQRWRRGDVVVRLGCVGTGRGVGVVLCHKKEGNLPNCNNMGGPEGGYSSEVSLQTGVFYFELI